MSCRFAFAALLLLPFPVSAQSIDLPSSVKVAKPGAVVIVPDKVSADAVTWVVLTPGLEQLDPAIAKPAFGTFVGVAITPGQYSVMVIVAKSVNGAAVQSAPVVVTVVIGMGGEVKPLDKSAPPSSFQEKLAVAWHKETAVDADKQAKELATAFRKGAELVYDKKLLTVGDFNLAFSKIQPTGQTLTQVHAIIGAELASRKVAEGTPLDDTERAIIAVTLKKIAAGLEGLK